MGGFVVDVILTAEFVSSKVQNPTDVVQLCAEVAVSQPLATHATLARSLQFEWSHLQRVIPAFHPLLETLNGVFHPALLGNSVSQHEVQLFALLDRFGGLGIDGPVETASMALSSSREGTSGHLDHVARVYVPGCCWEV